MYNFEIRKNETLLHKFWLLSKLANNAVMHNSILKYDNQML